ncbi:hypothetical protein AHF37_04324 [Paragonimus kellicotti]|nr:hypothetical protein AHF37_04324 [Paragonimus kellicotti]
MSTLSQQRKLVEQLRQEANLNRRPVSECVRDMISFMEQNRDKDCLVSGFASKKDNPFQEKGGFFDPLAYIFIICFIHTVMLFSLIDLWLSIVF